MLNYVKKPDKAVPTGEDEIVNDFVRRTPFWSYRAASYQIYEPFMGYKEDIDRYLEKLFAGEIDDGNGDVLDSMISDMERQAEKHLLRQHSEHQDVIKSFELRMLGDRKAFEEQVQLLKELLAANQAEQEALLARQRRDEFAERKTL